MPSSFFIGLSGLRAHSRAVEVVANNLANLNTIAFKRSRTDFRDLFYQTVGQSRSGVASQVGIGVAPITVSRRFEQGSIQTTGGDLDAAIQGEGFFVVADAGLIQFTRAGNFQLNSNQQVVTVNGENVQGWNRRSGVVNTNLPVEDITLQGNDIIDPSATANMRVTANLATGTTTPFSRPVEVFDSLGASHVLTLVFTPVAARTGASTSFDVSAILPAVDVEDATSNPPAADPNIVVAPGGTGGVFPIDFDSLGQLVLPAGAPPFAITLDMGLATAPDGTANPVTFANGAADLQISWDLLDTQVNPVLNSIAAASAVTDIFQDGSAPSELTSISLADGGLITGLYSDGRTLVLAELALQRFGNPQTLVAVGNNNFVPTAASGISSPGQANKGGLGSIVGLSLEFSNVDIAQEFTDLLTFQRGFQANSRVITTADELNQEALSLKR